MCTILIAVDFTTAAKNAIHYGVNLAKGMEADVVLVHVIKPIIFIADAIHVVTREALTAECRALLQKEAAALDELQVPIKIRVEYGNASEKILAVSQEENASWIIVGMKARDKTMRKIFGSNAVSLSKYSSIPLIIVPENAAYNPPGIIALANDLDENASLKILDPLQQLALKFQSYLFLLKVVNDDKPDLIKKINKPTNVKWYLKELKTDYEYLDDVDVAHAINEFVKNKDVHVIAMIAREHNLLERIFTRSHIKEMMFETCVPLIILPGLPPASTDNNLSKSYFSSSELNNLHIVDE